MPKELVLFYVTLLNVPLYIQWVTSEYLEHCDFVEPQGRYWISPYQTKKNSTIFKSKLSKSTITETGILLSQLSVNFQNKIFLSLFISVLVMSLLPDQNE